MPSNADPSAGRKGDRPEASDPWTACWGEPLDGDPSAGDSTRLTGARTRGTDPDPCDGDRQSIECRYETARGLFEAGRYDRAGPAFRELAFDPAAGEVAPYAAQLELECLNILGSRVEPPRPACFEALRIDVGRMRPHLCGAPSPSTEELCTILQRIAVDIERLRVEELVRRADSARGREAKRLYEQAGDRLVELFAQECRRSPRGNPASASDALRLTTLRCDEVLFNAARSFRAAGSLDKAERARRELLDPRNGLIDSPLAERLRTEAREAP